MQCLTDKQTYICRRLALLKAPKSEWWSAWCVCECVCDWLMKARSRTRVASVASRSASRRTSSPTVANTPASSRSLVISVNTGRFSAKLTWGVTSTVNIWLRHTSSDRDRDVMQLTGCRLHHVHDDLTPWLRARRLHFRPDGWPHSRRNVNMKLYSARHSMYYILAAGIGTVCMVCSWGRSDHAAELRRKKRFRHFRILDDPSRWTLTFTLVSKSVVTAIRFTVVDDIIIKCSWINKKSMKQTALLRCFLIDDRVL